MDEHSAPNDPIRPEPGAGDPGPRAATDQQDRPLPPPRRLHRRSDQAVVGGVCAGLGAYFRVDPVVFRIAFVIAVFASGAGLLGYLIAWAVIPDQTGRSEVGGTAVDDEAVGETPPWVWIALAVAAVVVLGGFTVQGGPSLLIAAGLVGLGMLLVRRDTARQHAAGAPAAPARPVSEPPPAGAWGSTAVRTAPLPAPAAPAPPRRASPVPRLTLGLAVIAVGIMLALELGTDLGFRPDAWTAVPLAVVGGGLVLGALVGGARSLIGWGAVLLTALLLTLGAMGVTPDTPDGWAAGQGTAFGELDVRPTEASQLRGSYAVGLGDLELDLRALDAEDLVGRTIDGNVGLGTLTVLVDADVPLELEGWAGIGDVDLLGRTTTGGLAARRALTDPEDAPEALRLDLRAGIGEVIVSTGGPR